MTDKINESAKKMLEDGLRRQRRSSQKDKRDKRQELRSSVTNIELNADGK